MFEDLLFDWDVYRDAAFALLAGHNPYATGQGQMLFFNPPWTLVILMPLLVLPRITGLILNAIISILIFIPITRRLKMDIWCYFFIVTSPMHLQSIGYGNVEWLPWCGVFFPAPIALIFYLIKPQATIGIILLTLTKSKRMAGFAGPFLSPYVTYHGWLSVLFPFKKVSMFIVWLLMFIPVLLNVANGGAINL